MLVYATINKKYSTFIESRKMKKFIDKIIDLFNNNVCINLTAYGFIDIEIYRILTRDKDKEKLLILDIELKHIFSFILEMTNTQENWNKLFKLTKNPTKIVKYEYIYKRLSKESQFIYFDSELLKLFDRPIPLFNLEILELFDRAVSLNEIKQNINKARKTCT